MNPLTEVWFWLLIISIIGFIISFVLFETYNQAIPVWIWVIYFVSIALLAASFIIFCYRMHCHHQLEACYDTKKLITYHNVCENTESALVLQPLEEQTPMRQFDRIY